MPQFSSDFKSETMKVLSLDGFMGSGGHFTDATTTDPRSLREWWHVIMRHHDKYPCYALFLVLPSDEEVDRFLKRNAKELHQISGKNCLIITLGNDFFFANGLYDENHLSDDCFVKASNNHVSSGESIQVAHLFNIPISDFPAAIFFTDVRSSNYSLVSLSQLDQKTIQARLREIFAIIKKHSDQPDKIIDAINTYNLKQNIGKYRNAAIFIVSKTIESLINSWIKASLET